MTLSREFETTAWAQHTTDGTFENVATVPGLISDEVYLVVKRRINGADRKYLERFDYTEYNNILADCSKYRYEEVANDTLTGLEHLEGKTLAVFADGKVHPNRTVTNGRITLEYVANEVWAGLPYTMTVELMNPEFGDAVRTSQGSALSILELTLRVQDTNTIQLNGIEIAFRTNLDGLDTGLQPFTGDKKVKKLGWVRAQDQEVITITSDKPTPCTVLGVIIEAAVNA